MSLLDLVGLVYMFTICVFFCYYNIQCIFVIIVVDTTFHELR